MIRPKVPFYGRGIAFPFRINPSTGGAQISEGMDDAGTVDLAYLREDWTIREDMEGPLNHIAESIAHILLTRPLEHDTLPLFGSEIFHILFEPNCPEFQMLAQHYFTASTDRWEKRAKINDDGVDWSQGSDMARQYGELPVIVRPDFIQNQVPGNLVFPFVNPLQQREQEYPLGYADGAGHDWMSRYINADIYQDGAITFIRPRKFRVIPHSSDDEFYKVQQDDSWLLISHKVYGDQRFSWVLAETYINDAAEYEESRENMDTTGDPVPGTLLRYPSRARLLSYLHQ
jgi:phage baseplate assembly protein W